MTTPNSFLGIPVEGDIVRSGRKDQRSLEELTPLIQALVDDSTIAEFGWRQYTPYFNDGDPCQFGAYGLWVRTAEGGKPAGTCGECGCDRHAASVDDEDEDSGGDTYQLEVSRFGSHPTLGEFKGGEWVDDPERPGRRKKVGERYEGPDEARFLRCIALANAIDGGEFLDVLLAAFGDHAEITVKKDGIRVGFYEHE